MMKRMRASQCIVQSAQCRRNQARGGSEAPMTGRGRYTSGTGLRSI
jgi:hypothetical protein